jgi:hypothetical protein
MIELDNEIIELLETMEEQLNFAAEDSTKFIQGNNSAGTRVRKAMQNIKDLAQRVRVEVQAQKNGVLA